MFLLKIQPKICKTDSLIATHFGNVKYCDGGVFINLKRKNEPMPHRYVEETSGSAAMLAAKRSAGVTIDVNFRERVTCMPPPSANKAAHSGFETQRRCHQKSKTGVSVATQKGLMSSNFFFKKNV